MVDVAGGGHIGLALETTHGTYAAPTKYATIKSESLAEVRTDPWRVPIIGRAVTSGKIGGRESVAGSLTMELIPEIFAYFLIASRFGANVAKTGGADPFTYTASDDAAVHVKDNKRSLTLVGDRAGVGFAYLGCQATSFRFYHEDGSPMVEIGILGREQVESYTPGSPTLPTTTPFNADEVSVDIAASTRADLASVEISVDDAGEVKYNIDGNTAASYIKFGEHVCEASFDMDFESKADYALWVARTTQELIYTADKASEDESVVIELHGAIYDTYEVNLSGIGDQVMANATLRGVYAAGDSAAITIAVETAEDITL